MAELVVYRSETTPAVARLAPKQVKFLHCLLSRSGDMFSQTHAVTSMVGECGVNWCTTAHGVLLGPRSAAMAHGGSCISMAGPRESRTGPTSGRTARPTSPQLFQGYDREADRRWITEADRRGHKARRAKTAVHKPDFHSVNSEACTKPGDPTSEYYLIKRGYSECFGHGDGQYAFSAVLCERRDA